MCCSLHNHYCTVTLTCLYLHNHSHASCLHNYPHTITNLPTIASLNCPATQSSPLHDAHHYHPTTTQLPLLNHCLYTISIQSSPTYPHIIPIAYLHHNYHLLTLTYCCHHHLSTLALLCSYNHHHLLTLIPHHRNYVVAAWLPLLYNHCSIIAIIFSSLNHHPIATLICTTTTTCNYHHIITTTSSHWYAHAYTPTLTYSPLCNHPYTIAVHLHWNACIIIITSPHLHSHSHAIVLMRLPLHHHYIITINAISSLLDPHPTIDICLSPLNCYLPATSILLLPLQHHCSIISLQSLLLNHHYALCSHIHIFSYFCDPYPYIPIFPYSHILIFYIITIALSQ